MPSLTPGSTILVTGGNGYIGSWVLQVLLSGGFVVRAAVRSLTKTKPLQQFFGEFVSDGKLVFVVVEDIIKDGAFDGAIVGVDGVLHLASPLPNPEFEDPEELIRPAVSGTLNVLKSAALPQSTVKRIVFTSSLATVTHPVENGRNLFDESDRSIDPELVETQGRKAHIMTKYWASKTLAEKAAWEFYGANKGSIGWDLACLNPPFVFGPPLQGGETTDAWTGTQHIWYKSVLSSPLKSREDLATSNSWIDVRDVAEAHVRALEKEAAGGERIIVSQGPFICQEWVDIVHSLDDKAQKGHPEIVRNKVYSVLYDTAKEAKILGMKYRSKEETTKDILKLLGKRL